MYDLEQNDIFSEKTIGDEINISILAEPASSPEIRYLMRGDVCNAGQSVKLKKDLYYIYLH